MFSQAVLSPIDQIPFEQTKGRNAIEKGFFEFGSTDDNLPLTFRGK